MGAETLEPELLRGAEVASLRGSGSNWGRRSGKGDTSVGWAQPSPQLLSQKQPGPPALGVKPWLSSWHRKPLPLARCLAPKGATAAHLATMQSPAHSFSRAAGPGRGLGLREGQRGTSGHIANCQPAGLQHPAPSPDPPGWVAPGTYHEERPFGLAEADDHGQRDAHHGGQGQAPAQPDGPGGVPVDFVVGQGHILYEREDKTSLWGDKQWSGASRARAGPTRGAYTLSPLLMERLPCSEPPAAPQGLPDVSRSSGQQCPAPCPLPLLHGHAQAPPVSPSFLAPLTPHPLGPLGRLLLPMGPPSRIFSASRLPTWLEW